MRTTIDFSDRLLKRLKVQAKEQGMTLSKYIEGLILMNNTETKKVKKRKFDLITVKGQLVDKNIDFNRPNEILAKEDTENFKK